MVAWGQAGSQGSWQRVPQKLWPVWGDPWLQLRKSREGMRESGRGLDAKPPLLWVGLCRAQVTPLVTLSLSQVVIMEGQGTGGDGGQVRSGTLGLGWSGLFLIPKMTSGPPAPLWVPSPVL